MTIIHEIRQVLWVDTPLGVGQALFLIDYGPHENCVFLVALRDSRELKHFVTEQVRISVNHTLGFCGEKSPDPNR